ARCRFAVAARVSMLARLLLLLCSFHRPAPPAARPLSLHDALPTSGQQDVQPHVDHRTCEEASRRRGQPALLHGGLASTAGGFLRSEEHTSELQSRFELVCRLLLEKKKII